MGLQIFLLVVGGGFGVFVLVMVLMDIGLRLSGDDPISKEEDMIDSAALRTLNPHLGDLGLMYTRGDEEDIIANWRSKADAMTDARWRQAYHRWISYFEREFRRRARNRRESEELDRFMANNKPR